MGMYQSPGVVYPAATAARASWSTCSPTWSRTASTTLTTSASPSTTGRTSPSSCRASTPISARATPAAAMSTPDAVPTAASRASTSCSASPRRTATIAPAWGRSPNNDLAATTRPTVSPPQQAAAKANCNGDLRLFQLDHRGRHPRRHEQHDRLQPKTPIGLPADATSRAGYGLWSMVRLDRRRVGHVLHGVRHQPPEAASRMSGPRQNVRAPDDLSRTPYVGVPIIAGSATSFHPGGANSRLRRWFGQVPQGYDLDLAA